MSERPFMQLYVSDFIGDTLQLSTEQIGAYMLLLMAMWNAGGKLPADDVKLARVVRMSVKKWQSISADLMTYFEGDNTSIWHNRLTKELEKSDRKSELRASAGAMGGAAKALKNNAPPLANATPELQHLPDTITRDRKREPDGSPKSSGSSEKKPTGSTPVEELSRVLDDERARAVVEHRQRIRKPITAYGAKKLAEKLALWRDPAEAADAMIANGWQGFEPAWMERRGEGGRAHPPPERPDPGLVTLAPDHPDFKAMERMKGRPIPVGTRGVVTFRKDEIEKARSMGETLL